MSVGISKKDKAVCAVVFAVYAVITLIGAANHELWFDEAQAWNIVRDNNLSGVFAQLKYEGHPPLWYLILYPFAHAGFSCTVIPFISWLFSAAAAAIVMLKAPFSVVTKAAVVFSSGFLFCNSVVSSVYSIIPLLLFLIAWLYPKRQAHPVRYGILVALLANTHIFMCGLIGVMGLIMIWELVGFRKTNGTQRTLFGIAGLAISGFGVLCMVLPVIGSLGANNFTSAAPKLTLLSAIGSVFSGFPETAAMLVNQGGENALTAVAGVLILLIFALCVVFMRKYPKPLAMLCGFLVFYAVMSGVIWYANPNRAAIFMYVFVMILWIISNEYKPSESERKIEDRVDGAALKKLLGLFSRADSSPAKSCAVLLTAVMLASAPGAAWYLYRDYGSEFNCGMRTAQYIRENLPEDAVFITEGMSMTEIAAYLPSYEESFYSLEYGSFYTFYTHKTPPEAVEKEKINSDLSGRKHLYRVNIISGTVSEPADAVYVCSGGMNFSSNSEGMIIISEYRTDTQ